MDGCRPQDYYCPSPPKPTFFHRIGTGDNAIKSALRALSAEIQRATGQHELVMNLRSRSYFGYEVKAGEVGCVIEAGLPRLILEPGKYWMLKPNRQWMGTQPLKHLKFGGVQIHTVQQNEVAIVADSVDHVFPVTGPGGFAAYNLQGDYTILHTLQTNTEDPAQRVMDPDTNKVLLGYRVGVRNANGSTVAHLLNIPANNVAIVQRGNKFEEIGGGQWIITDPAVTFRRFFTKGDMTIDAQPEAVYTKDQVAVFIKLAVKLQLLEPLKLVEHGFDSPYQALRDPVQSALISVVSRLKYTDFMSRQGIAPDARASSNIDLLSDAQQPFEEAVQSQCLEELKAQALEYGIQMKFVQVTNRTFQGEMVQTLRDLTTRTMKVNQEAELVKIENSNREKEAQGKQLVTQVEAQHIETLARANYTKAVKESEAAAQAKVNAAQAEKTAAILRAEGEAEALQTLARARASAVDLMAKADQGVVGVHAQRMQQLRNTVEQIRAMGNRTVIIPHESMGTVATHYAAGLGLQMGALPARENMRAT